MRRQVRVDSMAHVEGYPTPNTAVTALKAALRDHQWEGWQVMGSIAVFERIEAGGAYKYDAEVSMMTEVELPVMAGPGAD